MIDSEKKFFNNLNSLVLTAAINRTGVKYIHVTESYSAHLRKLHIYPLFKGFYYFKQYNKLSVRPCVFLSR